MLEFHNLLGPFIPSRDLGTDVVLSRRMTDVISSIKCLNITLELLISFFYSTFDSVVKFSLVIKFDVLFSSYDGLLLLSVCIYVMSFYRS